MDIDSPTDQPVTAASSETETAIRKNTYQEFMQRREELLKLVHDLPNEIQHVSDEISWFGQKLDFGIKQEHQSVQERYNVTLGNFKRQWGHVKEEFEDRYHSIRQPGTEQPAKLYDSVQEFVLELENLEQDFEVAINHPEQAFKKELVSLRETLEAGKAEGEGFREIVDEMMGKLENACKLAGELEKLAEQ